MRGWHAGPHLAEGRDIGWHGAMDASWLVSLVGFTVVMSITPGPNNIMVATAAAHHGVRATLPHMLGIALGFAAMLVPIGLGLGLIITSDATVASVLRWVMLGWIGWFAWKIATAPPPGAAGPVRPRMGFWGAALFQWVNPKAWLIALAAIGEWILPDRPFATQLAVMCAIFAVICLPCVALWAALGSGAGRLLGSPGRLRAFNVTMAALLLASVIPLLPEF
jgi:threonine/homoserine/homoserine lactone efflux protein